MCHIHHVKLKVPYDSSPTLKTLVNNTRDFDNVRGYFKVVTQVLQSCHQLLIQSNTYNLENKYF
jgi:hypothetical protein